MSIDTARARGQVAAEARMQETCTITRAGPGDTGFNSTTGVYTDAADTTVYTGQCEVQVGNGLSALEAEAGGTQLTISRLILRLPLSADDVKVNDVATITAVRSAGDVALLGKKYRVTAGFAKSFATARRLQVEEVT